MKIMTMRRNDGMTAMRQSGLAGDSGLRGVAIVTCMPCRHVCATLVFDHTVARFACWSMLHKDSKNMSVVGGHSLRYTAMLIRVGGRETYKVGSVAATFKFVILVTCDAVNVDTTRTV